MLFYRFHRTTTVAGSSRIPLISSRTHMNHGGEFLAPSSTSPLFRSAGPREACQLGLPAARATPNLLRLLESSTHGVVYSDTLDTIWHSTGMVWERHHDDEWKAQTPIQAHQSTTTHVVPPRFLWLTMSDDRSALAKIQGMNGVFSYVSMLRLEAPNDSISMMVMPNDGWQIVRQVNGSGSSQNNSQDMIVSIHDTLKEYLSIEHGGGENDAKKAQSLFAPQASLLAVGTAPLDEPPTDWSAPVGSYLEITLDTYLKGVLSQTPHGNECKQHDAIVQIDVLPCQTAAAATVHVGNGAQTTVFVDHLLLGYSGGEEQ